MYISPLAGKPAPLSIRVNVPRLITAYYSDRPDPSITEQRVAFGTSGHRGSSLACSFNEWHVLAITQAICLYRARQGIDGPLFIGVDTHALSEPAYASALEVLAANDIEVMIAQSGEYTPTPAISHAIVAYNRNRGSGMADGIVVTPSHNPPESGGLKYNPSNGGPAGEATTRWIEAAANRLLESRLEGVRRVSLSKALRAATTHRHDFLNVYVGDLANVVDMDILRGSSIRLGVDSMGGAGVHYWKSIAARYGLNLAVLNDAVDPTFGFMNVDWDGRIRMDPSSPYAMQTLIGRRDDFDVAFACDTDHDRHGIVTRNAGLMPSNHYLAVLVDYLYAHRPQWRTNAAVGKTLVSSQMIDRVASKRGRTLYEVPAGFKWFADGLLDGSLGYAGEESAGASCLRLDGTAWTTDKDGMVPALLAVEMTLRAGRDPAEHYQKLAGQLGDPVERRVQAAATAPQRARLSRLGPAQFPHAELAGERVEQVFDRAPGNGASIGGLKVVARNGWFAARPSGTEDIYKIYAESFLGEDHLTRILDQAQETVDDALRPALLQ